MTDQVINIVKHQESLIQYLSFDSDLLISLQYHFGIEPIIHFQNSDISRLFDNQISMVTINLCKIVNEREHFSFHSLIKEIQSSNTVTKNDVLIEVNGRLEKLVENIEYDKLKAARDKFIVHLDNDVENQTLRTIKLIESVRDVKAFFQYLRKCIGIEPFNFEDPVRILKDQYNKIERFDKLTSFIMSQEVKNKESVTINELLKELKNTSANTG